MADVSLDLTVTLGSAVFECRGDSEAVHAAFSAFREFYSEHSTKITPLTETPEASGESGTPAEEPATPPAEGATGGPRTPSDRVPLSVFLAAKKIGRSNSLIALGIAVWARKNKGEEVFTADTIKAYWRDSKRKVPANVNRDIGKAATEGWLERLASGAGNYGLTSYGEAHFEGLPAADE